jgi:mannosyltransferase
MDDYVRRHPPVDDQLKKNQFHWPGPGNRDPEWFSAERDEPIWSYHNSFEVVKLDAFRRPEVKDWLNELASKPERFFKYRWG